MANFDDIKRKAQDTLDAIADASVDFYRKAEAKTKEVARTTKLNADITMEKANLRKVYQEIGEKYYNLHVAAPENDLQQSCLEATTILDRIKMKQFELDEIKAANAADDIEVEIVVEDDESCDCGCESGEDSESQDSTEE